VYQMKTLSRITMTLFFTISAVLILFPLQGLAVEYSITDVKIDAFLQEDGSVKVKENHTYSFEGEFNGITRELFPKDGTQIAEFSATENGKALKVEKEDSLYKVHRAGEDESITVELGYTIKDGIDAYSDVAEFYWPFFDERNESTYEQLVITVYPPEKTSNVISFGYDEAFETEDLQADGSVVFNLGEVPSGENGDIRVAYDANLFSAATITADKPMRAEILKAHQDLLDQVVARAKTRENLSTIATISIPIITIIILGLMIATYIRGQMKKAAIEREMSESFFVPEQTMSMPATIVFTNGASLTTPETMAAALMDLVRQGYVTKISDTQFKMEHLPTDVHPHEQMLASFLFYEVGKDGRFSFEDLASYTGKESNHQNYHSKEQLWIQTVASEIKQGDLYEKVTPYRWSIAVVGTILVPLIVLFATYDLYGWFFGTILLSLTAIFYAIFYHPKSWKGLKLILDWGALKQRFAKLTEQEWQALTKDEQMRAYIYGIGIKNMGIIEKNEELVKSFKSPVNYQFKSAGAYAPADIAAFTYFGPMAASSFHTANETTQSSLSSSSSSSFGGGGGTGGGGGGSGAF
jgi:uncharacterized membrane protein